jgi:hypothetical protein
MRADPGFQGFQRVFKHSDPASPSAIVAVHVGEAGPGKQRGNFPRSPGSSPPPSRTVCHLIAVVVTLGENGWRASAFTTEQARTACAAGRGVQRAAMPGIYRGCLPDNATASPYRFAHSLVIAPCADSALILRQQGGDPLPPRP